MPIWHRAIIWTDAGILLIGPLGTNFNEVLIKIQNFSFMKKHLKMLSVKWRPFCSGEDELRPNPVSPGKVACFNWTAEFEAVMMMLWHGNTFHITVPLWGESSDDWWFNVKKGQWCRAMKFSLLSAWTSHHEKTLFTWWGIHPNNKLRWPHVGPTWILLAPRWANVGPIYLAILACIYWAINSV